MDSIIAALKDTPIPTILVIAGIAFLFLAIAGQLVGRIAVAPERQRWAAIIGGVLLIAGLTLHVVPQTRLFSPKLQEIPASGLSVPKKPGKAFTTAQLITEETTTHEEPTSRQDQHFFKFNASSSKATIIG